MDGTTALTAVVYKDRLVVANAGDSKAVLVRLRWAHDPMYTTYDDREVWTLSRLHRLQEWSSPCEEDLLTHRGARIKNKRVEGMLEPTRAIGHRPPLHVVRPHPDVLHIRTDAAPGTPPCRVVDHQDPASTTTTSSSSSCLRSREGDFDGARFAFNVSHRASVVRNELDGQPPGSLESIPLSRSTESNIRSWWHMGNEGGANIPADWCRHQCFQYDLPARIPDDIDLLILASDGFWDAEGKSFLGQELSEIARKTAANGIHASGASFLDVVKQQLTDKARASEHYGDNLTLIVIWLNWAQQWLWQAEARERA